MPKCRKCKKDLSSDGAFCPYCGAKQTLLRAPRTRGNGTGSVFQRPNKKWVAVKTVGYKVDQDGKMHRITRSKSGFKTKREALEYLSILSAEPKPAETTFRQLYDKWLPTHRAGKSTIGNYTAAVKYFEPIWYDKLSVITIDDLQDCMDDCPRGKRTKENMKALCGLMYKFAIPRRMTDINLAEYLIVGGGETSQKNALPDDALEKLERYAGSVKWADYVLCHCYLGFRPAEFLALDAKNYDRVEKAFTGGAKTDAGKNRIVTVSPKIQPIVDRLVRDKVSGPVFCTETGGTMSTAVYRGIFYKVLDDCGIENPVTVINDIPHRKYTPHSCRRTFATLMKRVDGTDKDKLELIGHSSNEMLRYYQDVSFEDIRKITDAI